MAGAGDVSLARSSFIECECSVSGTAAGAYLREAIRRRPQTPVVELISGYRLLPEGYLFAAFNDNCGNFAELRAVIVDARDRAQADLSCHATSEAIAA